MARVGARLGPGGDSRRMRAKRHLGLAVPLFAVVCVLDAWSKWWSQENLRSGPITLIQDWAWLRLAYNRGVAFSALEGVPHWALGGGAILLLVVVVWNLREIAERAVGAAALALVSAGGLCNAVDRLWDGQVTDMISVWKWPVFNVADTAITIGVVLLLLASRQLKAKEEEAKEASSPRTGAA